MAARARKHGMLFKDDAFGTACADDAPYGKLHDSFSPLYESRGRFHRIVDPGMTIHKSVQVRLTDAENRVKPGKYAPVNLDANTNYEYVD